MTDGVEPRVLGLLGGMAWPSTLEAYRLLNMAVNEARGGVASAELLVRSLDFAEVERLQANGDWDGAGTLLGDAAAGLERAGAGALLLCTNTMHRVGDAITDAVDIPLLHIADATAAAIKREGIGIVGLLGTRFTMEGAFYADRLRAHGLEVVVPDDEGRRAVHDVIYDELVNGTVREQSRDRYVEVVRRMRADAPFEGLIAGCTEIELLLGPDDLAAGGVDVAWFPTTRLHVESGAAWLLTGALPPAVPS